MERKIGRKIHLQKTGPRILHLLVETRNLMKLVTLCSLSDGKTKPQASELTFFLPHQKAANQVRNYQSHQEHHLVCQYTSNCFEKSRCDFYFSISSVRAINICTHLSKIPDCSIIPRGGISQPGHQFLAASPLAECLLSSSLPARYEGSSGLQPYRGSGDRILKHFFAHRGTGVLLRLLTSCFCDST